MNKQEILTRARQHISDLQDVVVDEQNKVATKNTASWQDIARLPPDKQVLAVQLKQIYDARADGLTHMSDSPYFSRIEIDFADIGRQVLYFGKHELTRENIYSWVAPITQLRFGDIGPVEYQRRDGTVRAGQLLSKEQYMIVDGKINFLSREERPGERELVHQEHLSNRKSGFMLPEIVAQMERAQDQVIRAEPRGSLVIAGPAGSGKTTLALHRIAYLLQQPDAVVEFEPTKVLVMVQDPSAKEYFSQLLPSLGINNVEITTFVEWAEAVLHIDGYNVVPQYGSDQFEQDWYAYHKLQAMQTVITPSYTKTITTVLNQVYRQLPDDLIPVWNRQKRDKFLDRIDLTILLQSFLKRHEILFTERTVTRYSKRGEQVTKREKTKREYDLVVLDEFQNYLPTQIQILRHHLNQDTNAMIYVGDMHQQTYLGTIQNWDQVGETISQTRNIKLEKVYRNTKSILQYLQTRGYDVSIPEQLESGDPVSERTVTSDNDLIQEVNNLVTQTTSGEIGILVNDQNLRGKLSFSRQDDDRVHVLSYHQAQGLEFETVIVVEGGEESEGIIDESSEFKAERARVLKDLKYVALTRAMERLVVFKFKSS